MVPVLAAFQFLTILPPIVRRAFSAEELGRAVGWYPLVGLALGGLLAGLNAGLRLVFPPGVVAVLLLIVWVVSTRALHMDGFMDACDGLFGGFTPERRLEIMRDSRVGAFGAVGGALAMVVKAALIVSLANHTAGLILAPVLGRWAMVIAIAAFPYAREQGLGRDMKDHTRAPQVIIGAVTALAAVGVAAWLAGPLLALIGTAAAGLAFGLCARLALTRVPGFTGDLYGALCEVTELAVLLAFTAAVG